MPRYGTKQVITYPRRSHTFDSFDTTCMVASAHLSCRCRRLIHVGWPLAFDRYDICGIFVYCVTTGCSVTKSLGPCPLLTEVVQCAMLADASSMSSGLPPASGEFDTFGTVYAIASQPVRLEPPNTPATLSTAARPLTVTGHLGVAGKRT